MAPTPWNVICNYEHAMLMTSAGGWAGRCTLIRSTCGLSVMQACVSPHGIRVPPVKQAFE